jgi:hypothetical protein
LKLPEIRSEGSSAGFHFADLFNNCQWKFYLRFVLGLEPARKALPLLFGSAFHYGVGCFYVTGDPELSLDAARRSLVDQKGHLEQPEILDAQLLRLNALLAKWIGTRGQEDLRTYEILGVEQEIKAPVPGLPGFEFTGRLDMVGRSRRSGFLQIVEHKTSGYSITLTEDSLHYGDQATAEIWLAQYHWPKEHVDCVVPDIAYWPRASTKSEAINCYRGSLITRSKEDIRGFQLGISQLFSEISQKHAALAKGRDPQGLFRRNTHYCVTFGRVCEYAEVCRDNRVYHGTPAGFVRRKPRPLSAIGNLAEDLGMKE